MSRFQKLEFNEHREQSQTSTPALKDGAFHLAEAQRAFARGRFEQALRSYAKVIEFEPGNTAAWAGQVRMLIELGEPAEARLWADKALDQFPNEPELLAAKAVALARTGDLQAALMFSDAAVEAGTHLPYAWLARGDVLLARREKRAEYSFDKALGLAPGDWMVRWLISRIHAFHRQFARAVRFAQEALELDTTQAAAWLQFGQCQLALGLNGSAIHSFEQAEQLDPECRPSEETKSKLAGSGWSARLRRLWCAVSGR